MNVSTTGAIINVQGLSKAYGRNKIFQNLENLDIATENRFFPGRFPAVLAGVSGIFREYKTFLETARTIFSISPLSPE